MWGVVWNFCRICLVFIRIFNETLIKTQPIIIYK
jgi:hypothetical protein